MGNLEDLAAGVKSRNGKRGSVNNKGRLAAFAERRGGGTAEWDSCDAEKMKGVVTGITVRGGAVTFGLSKDGGAHSLTLMLDAGKETLWFNGDAVLNDELDDVLGVIESMHQRTRNG